MAEELINSFLLSKEQLDSFNSNGFLVCKNVLTESALEKFHSDLKSIFKILINQYKLDIDIESCLTIDEICNKLVKIDRRLIGYIYDGMKGFPLFFQIVSHPKIMDVVNKLQNGTNPFVLDVNFRIDLPNEEKFSFDWHQDFWYTHSDPNSLVFWFPFTSVNSETGRLNVVSLKETKNKIFEVVETKHFPSYNAAYDLIEKFEPIDIKEYDMKAGDILIFKHSVMHKSGNNISKDKSRWTLQLRYSDYDLPIFKLQNWRTGRLSRDGSSYPSVQKKIQETLHEINKNG